MIISDESVRAWVVGRYRINSIVRQGNIIELRTSSRHFFLNLHGDTLTISRHCWDNEKLRLFEVPYETPSFFSVLEEELESPFPDWPEEPIIRAIRQRLRELYGHAAVNHRQLGGKLVGPQLGSRAILTWWCCYEAYIEADHLVLAAETWSRDQHVSRLLVADPDLWDKIGPRDRSTVARSGRGLRGWQAAGTGRVCDVGGSPSE